MLGIGEGKIDIQMNGFNFKPGDIIQGTVTLTLNKNIKAKGLIISLIGEQETISYHEGHRRRDINKVFDLGYPLDGEKEYSAGTPMSYPFRIIIPSNILAGSAPGGGLIQNPGGALGMVVGIAQSVASNYLSMSSRKLTQWYIFAKLDMPWAFDISKKIRVNIV